MSHARRGGAFTSPPQDGINRFGIMVWEAVEARLRHDLVDELSAAGLVVLNERADPVLADLWNNPVDGGLFGLRSVKHALRVFYMFLPGQQIVLLDGIVKKRDDIPAAVLRRLRLLQSEVLANRKGGR